MSKENENLISEALKTYKIPPEYVFASRENEEAGEAVIVTNGGKKVVHKKGEAAKFELSQMEITGEKPIEEMVWHKKLNQRISVKEILDLLKLSRSQSKKA